MKKITRYHKTLASTAFAGRPVVLENVDTFNETLMEGTAIFMEGNPPSKKRARIKVQYSIDNHEIEVINVEEKSLS